MRFHISHNPIWNFGVTHRIYTRTEWKSTAKLLPLPHEITDNLAREKKNVRHLITPKTQLALYTWL